MAKLGRYKVPREFKDEDKWFKIFTKKQLLFFIGAVAICAGVLFVANLIHLQFVGAVISVLVLAIGVILPRANMPDDKYLIGGGMPLDTLFVRVVAKIILKDKKSIYILNSEKEE